MLVIPATWEMEVGGLWSEAGLGKSSPVAPTSKRTALRRGEERRGAG
jgi:hypothetical protein